MMDPAHFFARLRQVRRRYLGEHASLTIASILIGLLASLSAVALKQGVHAITAFAHHAIFAEGRSYMVFFIPMCGLLLSVAFVRLTLPEGLGNGLPALVRDVRLHDGRVAVHKMWSQLITGILTMGAGGSAGLEPPIATTGAAIGSNVARWLRFDRNERVLLLASGAAAGVAAIFNAPIAGTVFALEILLANSALPLLVPMLISSACATLLSSLIYSGQPFVLITSSWNASALPFYLALAFVAAFISVYVTRIYRWSGKFAAANFRSPYVKAVVGGLLLGTLLFFFPPLFGEGYESVVLLLKNNAAELAEHAPVQLHLGVWNIVMLTLGLTLLKVLATALTVNSGGNGGMFGPSLFIGGMLGFTFAHAVNLTGFTQLNEINFTVVGMAAVLSGVIHVPLTAIFLIAEITGGYALFVPLMIVASLTFLLSRYLQPTSVYGTAPDLPVRHVLPRGPRAGKEG